jgi:hypothetical protein
MNSVRAGSIPARGTPAKSSDQNQGFLHFRAIALTCTGCSSFEMPALRAYAKGINVY